MTISEAIKMLGGKQAKSLVLGKVLGVTGSLVEVEPLDGTATILDARLSTEEL